MTAKELVLNQLKMGQVLIGEFTADLSDAEYFQPPLAGANHATWILGHLACTEDWAMSLLGGTVYRIPQKLHDAFKGGSTCDADATKYPGRREIDRLFAEARAFTLERLAQSDLSTWANRSPEGFPANRLPTVASVWSLMGLHQFWHFGQLTVCRQAMKKGNVFGRG